MCGVCVFLLDIRVDVKLNGRVSNNITSFINISMAGLRTVCFSNVGVIWTS